MSQEDFRDIEDALLELGVAMVFGVEMWTYEQRLKYEAATKALVKYKEENGK